MGRSVRISEEDARVFEELVGEYRPDAAPLGRLRSALARLDRIPKEPRAPRKKATGSEFVERWTKHIRGGSRKPSKEEKRDATAVLWKAAMARSGGSCECGCGRVFAEEGENKPEMDHEASRRVPQTLQNVWMLALAHHRMRQQNRPSERWWLGNFLVHCRRHGYLREADRVEARIAVVEVKAALPAAPRTQHNADRRR
jgi:hypothetical protein